jgi:Sushi repeat (SCR repeat)
MLKLLTVILAALEVASSQKCGRPGWPAFSDSTNFTVKNSYDVGETIVYRCLSGYKFLGHNRSTCQVNGTWSQPPICITKFKEFIS